jgi:ankyrin repeat protein
MRYIDLNGRLWNASCANKPDSRTIQSLLAQGANPNAPDAGSVPLVNVMGKEDPEEVVRLLLQYGANVEGSRNPANLPIVMAASLGNVKITKLLLAHGANVHVRDHEGKSALFRAKEGRRIARTSVERRSYDDVIVLLKQSGAVE